VVAGLVYGWTHAPLFVQQHILTAGWVTLASITALQTVLMVFRLLRPRAAACARKPAPVSKHP
jgi:hypothetical protein